VPWSCCSTLVTGGAYALLSPATAQDSAAGDEALVSQGRELLLVGCASCHGKNAEGIVTQDGTQYGPSLVGVGAAAVDFQVSTGRMPMAQPGVQAPRKDRLYNEEETRQLAAYVASLGPGPAIPTPEQYDPETIPEEEREEAIVRGGEFFRTNCTACHNFAGSGGALPGGKYAPTLIGVEPKHVYEAMLTGPQQMPVFSDDVLKPEEKRDDRLPQARGVAQLRRLRARLTALFRRCMFAWLAGIGVLAGLAVWIAAHSTRSKKVSRQ
jgi:ubiquinol-cytochrome c reductase cytochrome c subunit